jgi:hypothetical protein
MTSRIGDVRVERRVLAAAGKDGIRTRQAGAAGLAAPATPAKIPYRGGPPL